MKKYKIAAILAEEIKISTHSQKCESGADFYINSNFFDLQKLDSIFLALCDHIFWPQRGLYFSNVCFAQEEHTDTGLSDAAADGVWKFFVDDCFLERKIFSFFTASLL